MSAHGSALTAIEKMPRGDEVQSGVSRTEAAAVEHADKVLATHEEICRNKIPVAHDVGSQWRQLTQPAPHTTEPRDVEEILAVIEADRQPLVVVGKIAAPSLPIEATAVGFRRPQRRNE